MPTTQTLAAARTAWLAGAPGAWAHYLACLRQAQTPHGRTRTARRSVRPRARRTARAVA